jgi:hypothetical protein
LSDFSTSADAVTSEGIATDCSVASFEQQDLAVAHSFEQQDFSPAFWEQHESATIIAVSCEQHEPAAFFPEPEQQPQHLHASPQVHSPPLQPSQHLQVSPQQHSDFAPVALSFPLLNANAAVSERTATRATPNNTLF